MLQGKVILVTGSSSGIGLAIARAAQAEGATVVLHGIEAEALARAAVDLGGVASVLADVTAPDAAAAVIDAVRRTHGRIDGLVNNAASLARTTLEQADEAAFDAIFAVNARAPLLLCREAVRAFRAQGTGGAIVNIGSVAGLKGGHPSLLYPTSKGAVVNMTRAMAVHHAMDGIRVNCVCPGMVYTPMVQANDMTPAKREARRKRSILQVEGSGWDIGAAVTFLCGGNARWMTGAIVPVDAGATAIAALPSGLG